MTDDGNLLNVALDYSASFKYKANLLGKAISTRNVFN